LQKQIDQLDEKISENKRNLAEIQSVRELATERRTIESEIEKLNANAETSREKLKNLNSMFYKTVLLPIAESIIDQLRLKHEKIMGKYNEKQRLLGQEKDLLKGIYSNKCKLCGNILDAKKVADFEHQLIEVRSKIEALTEVPEPNLIYETSAQYLKNMRAQASTPEKYKAVDKELNVIEHKIAAKKAILKQIEQKLLGADEDEPFRLEVEIRRQSEELGRLKGEKYNLKNLLEEDFLIQSELNQKLSGINREELNILSNRIKLTGDISNVFEDAISVYRNQRKEEVEAKATEIFRQIRSKTDFDKLDINENFGLSIVTKRGTLLNRSEWRSAGEEQIVALALIGALNKCAQIEAPVFMDTPFGRLDLTHGRKVLSFLPKMSEQVVVFVTDREFRKEDEEYLGDSIKSDHVLEYRGEQDGSFIVNTLGKGDSL
jgi:DNA sulfur modification protein DndD